MQIVWIRHIKSDIYGRSVYNRTPSAQAATPDEQAVLAPVNAMFDGMAKRDAALIKEPLLRAAPWCSCETANPLR